MDSNYVDKLKCLNKTVTIIRPGEVHDDYSWALKLTDGVLLNSVRKVFRMA